MTMTKKTKLLTALLGFFVLGPVALATEYINSNIAFQGLLKNATTGLAITDGTYAMRFIIKKTGTGAATLWTKSFTGGSSISVSGGVFSVILSGADDSATQLTPALLAQTASDNTLTVDVLVDINASGTFTGADDTYAAIPFTAVPMAMIADRAYNTTGLQGRDVSSAAPAANQVLTWNNGLSRWEPAAVAIGNVTGGAASGANSDITSLTGLSTPLSVAQGGSGFASYTAGDLTFASGATAISKLAIGASGTILNSSGTAPQWSSASTLGLAASGSNSDITELTGLTTDLTVAQGGTGASTFTSNNLLMGNGAAAISAVSTAAMYGGTLAGGTTAYTLATTPTFTPSVGSRISFKVNATNTGAVTLNVNATSAVTVVKHAGGALAANEFPINKMLSAVYDGTNWVLDPYTISALATNVTFGAGVIGQAVDASAQPAAITGAAIGDPVHCAATTAPTTLYGAAAATNMAVFCFVSAANTITVRRVNGTTAGGNPGVLTWNIHVLKL